jgi:carboxylesterase
MKVRLGPGRALLGLCLLLGACQIVKTECDQECRDGFWLDSGQIPDPCVDTANTDCLVSTRIPAPSDSQKESLQVVIAVHGYTASTYEWREYKDFAEDTANGHDRMRISLVLLGGHGRDLDAFQASTWRQWGAPILAEYDALVKLGYKNISFACASTGCALLMQYISDGAFAERQPPRWIHMIDPIVVPSAKLLSLVDLVGPVLGNSPNEGSPDENRHWYVNRPQETLQELYELVNLVKNRLETGFSLPKGTKAKVYKTKHDNSADPVGALLIYKGMRKADGSHIEAQMLDSRLHVFTRLMYRDPAASDADRALQKWAFGEMTEKILARP